MGKLTNLLIIMTAVIVIFNILGITNQSNGGGLIYIIFHPDALETSTAWAILFGTLGVFTIAGILFAAGTTAAGFKFDFTILVNSGVMTLLGSFLLDFISIYSTINQASTTIALFIFAPLVVIYFMTLIEWWRGITT
jgi:hypothetical protein